MWSHWLIIDVIQILLFPVNKNAFKPVTEVMKHYSNTEFFHIQIFCATQGATLLLNKMISNLAFT